MAIFQKLSKSYPFSTFKCTLIGPKFLGRPLVHTNFEELLKITTCLLRKERFFHKKIKKKKDVNCQS